MMPYICMNDIPYVAYFRGRRLFNEDLCRMSRRPLRIFVSQPFHDIPEETIMKNMDTIGRAITDTQKGQNDICTSDAVCIYDTYHMPDLGSTGENLFQALKVIDISDIVVFAGAWEKRGSCMVEYKYVCALEKTILFLRNDRLVPYRFGNCPQNLQIL